MPDKWKNERYTDENGHEQSFQSEDEYNRKVEEWNAKNPGFPGPWDAFWGWQIARIIIRVWADDGVCNDKWLHCYIGCRIAEVANEDTAKYAGWRKEWKDLTDGDPTTHFEEADYDATISCVGQNCIDCCSERFGDPWPEGCKLD